MDVSPQEFRDIQTLVRGLCGLVLSDDKTYLVRTRLESVVRAHGCRTFAEYLGRLQQTSAVLMRDELVEALTTGETSFNRDAHPFEQFRRQILPALAESICRRRAAGSPAPVARIWSAGCSTGQEPYGIAMAVQDFIAQNASLKLRSEHFPILATDISTRSLNFAKEGCYSKRDLDRGLSMELQTRYFSEQGCGWVVHEALRRSIEFRRMNFIDLDTGLGPFEVIFCRNVMIYFDATTRQRLCDKFQQLLVPGGRLILGAAENLYGIRTALQSEQIGNTTCYRNPNSK